MLTLDGKPGTNEKGEPMPPMLFRQFVYGRVRDPAFGGDERALNMDAVVAVSRVLSALDQSKTSGVLVLEDDHYKRLLQATKSPSKQLVCPTCGSRGGYNADAWTLLPFMEAIATAVSAQPEVAGWIEPPGEITAVAAE
jgi:hypothetical protein